MMFTTNQPTPSSTVQPTSTAPVPSTSVASELVLTLRGSPVVYSADGAILISGWVDRPAEVTVDARAVVTHTEPSGRTSFEHEIVLGPGDHEIEVAAADSASRARATVSLEAIVDPAFEEQLAFVEELDPETNTLVADYAEMLTGEEARAAAREDGFIGEEEDLPGDFYIRNQNPRLRTLTMSGAPVVVLIACYPEDGPCITEEAVDVEIWQELMDSPDGAEEMLGWSWYGQGSLPYWLTMDEDVVVQINEQYLP